MELERVGWDWGSMISAGSATRCRPAEEVAGSAAGEKRDKAEVSPGEWPAAPAAVDLAEDMEAKTGESVGVSRADRVADYLMGIVFGPDAATEPEAAQDWLHNIDRWTTLSAGLVFFYFFVVFLSGVFR